MLITLIIWLVVQQDIRVEEGIASYYTTTECGHNTASGIPFDDTKYTCATKFGHYRQYCLIVSGNNYVFCQITDYGPHISNRIVDLSKVAMQKLNGIEKGLIPVKVYLLGDEICESQSTKKIQSWSQQIQKK